MCCDVCEGWSHLRSMGMKEGVGVMEGKKFVCQFCVSACLLALKKEVGGLREELSSVKSELKKMKEGSEVCRQMSGLKEPMKSTKWVLDVRKVGGPGKKSQVMRL